MGPFGNRDPRNIPTYSFAEAAHHLRLPPVTLRAWAKGRYYPGREERHFFPPVIEMDDPAKKLLSFTNLVELHTLARVRRVHGVQLDRVRTAVQYVASKLELNHPLAHQEFKTDGIDLFIDHYGQLVSASASGQLAMRALIEDALQRVEVDPDGLAARLFPYTRSEEAEAPRLVVIDPRVSFGRPVLAGTGIPTAIVAERYKAGESIDSLMMDYRLGQEAIEEAIRCELPVAA